MPYAVGEDPVRISSSTADAAPEPAPSESALSPLGEAALAAPPDAETWRVGDVDVAAPPGKKFAFAIVRDFDGDGRVDALALVVPKEPRGDAVAALVHYRGAPSGTPAPTVVTTGPQLSEGCDPVLRLARVGERSAMAEMGTTCARAASAREIDVVRLGATVSVAFDLVVHDPLRSPKLTVDVDGADRDHDGIDDITFRLTIEGGSPPFEPGPRLTAQLAYFDRPAGPSRDADEPDASLRAIADLAHARAARAKEAPGVPALVAQMRALYGAMCQEGGAPRLTRRDGSALTCGTSRPLEQAGVAEVRAYVSEGDVLHAFAAADLATQSPATKTKSQVGELASLLAKIAPEVTAERVDTLKVPVDQLGGHHPEWGPLVFDGPDLLVRHGNTVVRVDLSTGDQIVSEMAAWPTRVLAPDGKSRWLEAYHACEGVALRATFSPTEDGDVRDVVLPVAPALGTRCVGARGEAARAVPIAWGPRGLEALVLGEPVLIRPDAASATVTSIEAGPSPPGSPRSPHGQALALATSRGVLVRAGKSFTLTSRDLQPYDNLRHCAIDDSATRVACVLGGRVRVAKVAQ